MDALKEEKQEMKAANLAESMKTYAIALQMAYSNNWALLRKSDYHFQLFHAKSGRLYNLYPSNQRIFVDRNHKGKTKFLKVPTPWTVLDAVKEAIKLN